MPSIVDEEFGTITLRRSTMASSIRIKVAPNGTLRASLPLYAPLFLVKRMLKTSRPQLRAMLAEHQNGTVFESGMAIGKSHTLLIRTNASNAITVTKHGQQIIAVIPETTPLSSSAVQQAIREKVISALRLEAKSYLPKRLAFLAEKHGFSYQKVRFSHSSGRWGSCSSNGTISLNIALMKLPFNLIDYVLIHELSHTVHMNHSDDFWQCVASSYPTYKKTRALLKKESPSV